MRELDLDPAGATQYQPENDHGVLNAASREAGNGASGHWNLRFREALRSRNLCIIADPGFRPLPAEMRFAPIPYSNDAYAWPDGSVIVRIDPDIPVPGYPFIKKQEPVNQGETQSLFAWSSRIPGEALMGGHD